MADKSETDIPVIVDDVKINESFPITRCMYFSIECDEPSPNWTLGLNQADIPFYLLDLSGIIFKPMGEDQFLSPASIDGLFELIEGNESFFVDTNEVWFPNHIFSRTPERGDVYRIPHGLFFLAMQFQRQSLAYVDYLSKSREVNDRLRLSELETKAFLGWEKKIRGEAREGYPKNRELVLQLKDEPRDKTNE